MAALDFAVDFGAAGWDVPVGDAQIGQMPSELSPERGVVVSLDPLDGEGQVAVELIEEVQRRAGVVGVVGAQDAEARGFVNGRELVEALARPPQPRQELHIQRHRLAGERNRLHPCASARAGNASGRRDQRGGGGRSSRGTRDAEEPAGLIDVERDLLSVLEHAKPSLGLVGLLFWLRFLIHSG